MMATQARTPMTKSEVKDYLRMVVPIIVLGTKDEMGNRFIAETYFAGAERK